jgi:hypothetical protein
MSRSHFKSVDAGRLALALRSAAGMIEGSRMEFFAADLTWDIG